MITAWQLWTIFALTVGEWISLLGAGIGTVIVSQFTAGFRAMRRLKSEKAAMTVRERTVAAEEAEMAIRVMGATIVQKDHDLLDLRNRLDSCEGWRREHLQSVRSVRSEEVAAVVNEEGNLELQVTERRLPCETDRRVAWWTVLLSYPITLIACATAIGALVVTVQVSDAEDRVRAEADREVTTLQRVVREQDDALNCRARARATFEVAAAEADRAVNELELEVAQQFGLVLQFGREETDPPALRRKALIARQANVASSIAASIYQERTGECGTPGTDAVED